MTLRRIASLSTLAFVAAKNPTWWVDKSCDVEYAFGPGVVDEIMNDVVETAQWTIERLRGSGEEQEAAHVAFQALFKYDWTNPGSNVNEVLKSSNRAIWDGEDFSITSFEKQEGTGDEARINSNWRIYCDNDERWELVKDDPDAPDSVIPNSQRAKEDQEWVDPINRMRKRGIRSCLEESSPDYDDTNGFTLAYASRNIVLDDDNNDLNPPLRSVVTFCDKYLELPHRVDFFPKLDPQSDLQWVRMPGDKIELMIDAITAVSSMTMLHEMTHMNPHLTSDYAYTWREALGLGAYAAAENAQSYSFMGILIRMLERNLRLEKGKEIDGRLFYDSSIPSRG